MTAQRELTEELEAFGLNLLANLHTVAICKVTTVQEKTLTCQPVTARVVNGETKPLPEFIEVPPLFLYGGETYEAYPIAIGDYALVLIAERCFDRWYDGADFEPPAEMRMHDYSDGFALVAPKNKAGALTIPQDGRIWQIGPKYKEGDHEHKGSVTQEGDYTQTGNVTLTGDVTQEGNHTINGDLTVNGTLTVNGDITCSGKLTVAQAEIGGINFATHKHGGVTSGGAVTLGPQ